LVLDHVDHNLVIDKLACVDDFLRHLAELGVFSNLLAEEVAGREMANTELISYFRCLGALSCDRRDTESKSAPVTSRTRHPHARKELVWGGHVPAPGGPIRMVRSC